MRVKSMKKTHKNALLGKTNQITLIREIPLKSAIKGLILATKILATKISSLSDHGLRTPFGLRCLWVVQPFEVKQDFALLPSQLDAWFASAALNTRAIVRSPSQLSQTRKQSLLFLVETRGMSGWSSDTRLRKFGLCPNWPPTAGNKAEALSYFQAEFSCPQARWKYSTWRHCLVARVWRFGSGRATLCVPCPKTLVLASVRLSTVRRTWFWQSCSL